MSMAGQVAMLDITNPARFKQVSVVSLGPDAGPHSVHLTHDDKRLVVTDYFLDQGTVGKVHLDGDHKVRVLDVKNNRLDVVAGLPGGGLQYRLRDRACAAARSRDEITGAESRIRRNRTHHPPRDSSPGSMRQQSGGSERRSIGPGVAGAVTAPRWSTAAWTPKAFSLHATSRPSGSWRR
jgi:hypothetical protein